MTDFIDRTLDREQDILDSAVLNRVQYKGVSATHCETCDEPIPQGRQLAVPGVTLCAWCAEVKERR